MKRIAVTLSISFLAAGCSNAAEEAVRAELIDPDSAQFREVETCFGDRDIIRGEVNGKNRMGAYTGFEFFFVDHGVVYFAGTDGVMEVMDRCYKTGDLDVQEESAANGRSEDLPDLGDWMTNTDRDPIDDSAVVTATLIAESGQAKFGDPVTLVARCSSNKTELYAIWNEYVGDDSRSVYNEYKNVEVRVGDDPARTEQWGISTDKQATFANSAVALLKEMDGKEKLALRMTPYGENPITAIFNLTGFRGAVEPIANECDWEF